MPTLEDLMGDGLRRATPPPDPDVVFHHLTDRRRSRRLVRRTGSLLLAATVVVATVGGFLVLDRAFRGDEPNQAATPVVPPGACQPSEVSASFSGVGARDVAQLACDANGQWMLSLEWASGATDTWGLDLCGEACAVWSAPDLDGDGDEELLIWSRRPVADLEPGYVFVLDPNARESPGVPLGLNGGLPDGLPSLADRPPAQPVVFPIGGDEGTLGALSCEQPAIRWTMSTQRDDGIWDVRTIHLSAGQDETGASDLVELSDVTNGAFGPAGQPEAMCGAPIVGPRDARTPAVVGGAEPLPGVPFPVCRPTSIAGDFGGGLDTVWLFERERLPGVGCVGSEGFHYIGIGTPDRVELLSEEIHDIGQTTTLWPFATPDVDGDGIEEIAIGIGVDAGSTQFVLFRVLDSHVEQVTFCQDCGFVISWGGNEGHREGAYCDTEAGTPLFVTWNAEVNNDTGSTTWIGWIVRYRLHDTQFELVDKHEFRTPTTAPEFPPGGGGDMCGEPVHDRP